LGAIAVYFIKTRKLKDVEGNPIEIYDKDKGWPQYIIGGLIFGLGWALSGACPGPMFVNLGYGYLTMSIVILGALLGTYLYGIVKHKLPH
jgi:uncharacterized membrane protein YedE/YeeE